MSSRSQFARVNDCHDVRPVTVHFNMDANALVKGGVWEEFRMAELCIPKCWSIENHCAGDSR